MIDDTKRLLAHLHRGGSWGNYWQAKNIPPVWYPAGQPCEPPDTGNVYFSVHPRREKLSGYARGGIADIAAVNCLFAEYDAYSPDVHPDSPWPDKEAILSHLADLPIAPSVIDDSGGGIQTFWLIDPPSIIRDETDRARMAELQERWVKYVRGDDGAKDLARVLRVPGTQNHKYTPPRDVCFMTGLYDLEKTYTLELLESVLPFSDPKPAPPVGDDPGLRSKTPPPMGGKSGERPGDKLAASKSWADILTPHGWKLLDNRGEVEHWQRPGKGGEGLSATVGHEGHDTLYVFSSNAAPFEPDTGYSKFTAYTLLNHGGDFSAAARALSGNGHGHAVTVYKPPEPDAPPDELQAPQELPQEQNTPAESISLANILECLNRNEYGDAELLARLFSGRLCYDAQAKEWLFFEGNYWKPDTIGHVKNLLATAIASRYIGAAAQVRKADGDDKLEKSLLERSRHLRFIARTRNVLAFAESIPGLATDGNQWDKCEMILPVENGLIDLKTGSFRQGKPTDFIKTFAPTRWEGINTPAPTWEQFIADVLGNDRDKITYVQRLFGYAITGKCTERVFPTLYGEGSNGKSTLLEILGAVLGGDLTGTFLADALMATKDSRGGDRPNPALYGLRGKRLVWASESKEGQQIDMGLVKLATGGIDQITTRTLYQAQNVTFRPTFVLMLLTNHKPHVPSDDLAMWDRVRLLEFSTRFVDNPTGHPNERKKAPFIAGALLTEAPGILAWLVRGALAWQREGQNFSAWVDEATKSYQLEEDTLYQYATERLCQSDSGSVRGAALYKNYCEWCKTNNLEPMNGTVFGRKMGKKFTKTTDKRGTTYTGITWLDAPHEGSFAQ